MKKISLAAFILLFPLIVFAQTKPADSARDKETGNEQQKIQKQEKALSADHDTKPSKNDRFIDLDGDGINDNRAKGVGWSTLKEKQKGFGKHQEIGFPGEYLPLIYSQMHI